MKSITIFFILFFSNFYLGQKNFPDMNEDIVINENLTAKPGDYYIEDLKVDFTKTIIHQKNIKNIKVYKGESAKIYSGAKGATVITRKIKYKFISLSTIIESLEKNDKDFDKEKPYQIVVDKKLIENPKDYIIEQNPKFKISIIKYSDEGVYHGGKENKPNPVLIIKTKN